AKFLPVRTSGNLGAVQGWEIRGGAAREGAGASSIPRYPFPARPCPRPRPALTFLRQRAAPLPAGSRPYRHPVPAGIPLAWSAAPGPPLHLAAPLLHLLHNGAQKVRPLLFPLEELRRAPRGHGRLPVQ